jgi:SSS family solute:Na+ symporter
LFVPVLAALYGKKPNARAAIASMITGGTTTVALTVMEINLPFGLDPNIFGILSAAVVYYTFFYTAIFVKKWN